MKKILVIGGSNSIKSINKKLAIYAAKKLENVQLNIIDLNDFVMPIYGIDYELEYGIPEKALEFDHIISETDALIISLAEHNGSYSVAFKNILDWLSRIDQKVWKNKPMLLMATSPGKRGGANVLEAAKKFFPHLGGNIVADFILPSYNANFNEKGINNDEYEKLLVEAVAVLNKAFNSGIHSIKS
ncbi:NADPH-dependent FMN reductase [Aquimarina agarilytica]|uniref:NADPH-dependent FMN reductase n=1 Tax=Aquimarina agarilytica TaxID=1087449 RepID=UPI000287D523|nr:NAD(P)H-dependent oxidoreductase [Aquimarina agarilytica]